MTTARSRALPMLAAFWLAGCTATAPPPGGRLSASQQILASEAVDRALAQLEWPEVTGRRVFVDAAAPSGDQEIAYLEKSAAALLAERGAILTTDAARADYAVLVVADAIGIEQSSRFFGLPAAQSSLIPIGVPEISLYDSAREEGYARLEAVVTDLKRGGVIARSGPVDSETWFQQRTILLVRTHASNTEELEEDPR